MRCRAFVDVVVDGHRQTGDDPRRRPAGGAGGVVDHRRDMLGDHLRCRQPEHGAVGDLARHPQQARPERRHEDGDGVVGRHHPAGAVHRPVVAVDIDRVAPQQPDDDPHVLLGVGPGRVVVEPVHVADHRLVRRPDAEGETGPPIALVTDATRLACSSGWHG